MFAFVKQIRKAFCWTLFLWKPLVVESNWLLCQDAVESSLGRIDYERKEKGFISADGLGGEGRWKREEKAGKRQRKKRLRRKNFKRLNLLKMGFEGLLQTDLFRTCSVFLLIIVWYLYTNVIGAGEIATVEVNPPCVIPSVSSVHGIICTKNSQ